MVASQSSAAAPGERCIHARVRQGVRVAPENLQVRLPEAVSPLRKPELADREARQKHQYSGTRRAHARMHVSSRSACSSDLVPRYDR